MKLKQNFKAILLFLLVGTLQHVQAQERTTKFIKVQELGGIEEYLYEPNGMNLLLVQDNSAPVVTVQIVYRVGSKHEVSGNTGSTHLLEHLMFKGTEKFNKRKGTSIDSKLNNIGAQMNASTWNDRTNYYETIPSDKIEIALEIEADRMRNSLLLKEDKDAEMTVVRNEFERGENNPNEVLNKEIWSTAYMAHTYHHSTIGWRSDIEKMPIEALRNFYNTYYWPDNATLTIIGDFKKDHLFELVDKYFGKITKAPHVMPQPYTEEPVQYGPRKVVIKKPGQMGVINISYKIPGRLHEDLPALEVLSQIIGSGTSSVLNRTFVDSGKAYYAYASASNFKEVGLFSIGVGFNPLSNHEELNKEIIETIENIKKEGVQQADIDRIISKLNVASILSRDGSGSIADQLAEAIAGGDWRDYINTSERLNKVTLEDVNRVAKKYLVEDQSTTGYFIPKNPGTNKMEVAQENNYVSKTNGKYFYRNPSITVDEQKVENNKNRTKGIIIDSSEEILNFSAIETTKKEDKFIRKNVYGIDVVTAKTGAKDFVTVEASFPIAGYLNTRGNEVIPTLTVSMLSKGTSKNDKFKFSEKLEKLGVSIDVNADSHKISIGFKCLKKDVSEVISLLAEELRYPLFEEKEFELIKQQISGNLKQGLTDPGTQGGIALSQVLYPKGHPNYQTDIETSLKNIESATIQEMKDFHKIYFGPKGMHMVVVGDVDTKSLYSAIKASFHGWTGGITEEATFTNPSKVNSTTKVITIPQKPSAEMLIGQYTGLKRSDKDFMPFYIGNFAFGGGFSGRLMRSVRDEEGLTYSIGSSHKSHIYTGGFWQINASFNPTLFEKGLQSTMDQLKKWVNEGITKEELEAKKTNLTGSFKVGLSTTGGLANTLLSFIERGLEPNYIDQYSKDIEAVTLEEVNNAIKKYIDLDKLIIIKSGSLDQDSNPLK